MELFFTFLLRRYCRYTTINGDKYIYFCDIKSTLILFCVFPSGRLCFLCNRNRNDFSFIYRALSIFFFNCNILILISKRNSLIVEELVNFASAFFFFYNSDHYVTAGRSQLRKHFIKKLCSVVFCALDKRDLQIKSSQPNASSAFNNGSGCCLIGYQTTVIVECLFLL